MALKPITRQEQIVTGKELEPITRMERFLKDYGVSKYFGETTVKGDTLTWDGNTEGLVSMDACAEMIGTLYKISDAVPTLEDCISGVTYTGVSDRGQQYNYSVGYDEIVEMSGFVGCLCIGDFNALVAPENNFQIEIEGVTAIFPEAGLYSGIGGDTILTSLTIPGYNGFVTTVVKPIDTKYMPEALQFGETVVKDDTLIWDGNTEGLVTTPDGVFVKLSSTVVTADDVANGYKVGMTDEGQYIVREYGGDEIDNTIDGMVGFGDGTFMCAYKDNVTVQDSFFPEKGIYVAVEIAVAAPMALTIPGYNCFETTVIKPIETKYLPEHLQFGTETKVVEGDTLTWDGNTEGRTVLDFGGYPLVHVSDAVVTAQDVANGYSMETADGVMEFQSGSAQGVEDNVLMLNDESYLFCCSADNCSLSSIGLVFPKKGVYFLGGEYGIKSLTIPNYGKFVSKQTVVKPLAEQYMPILTSPIGKKFKLSVDDSGVLSAVEV